MPEQEREEADTTTINQPTPQLQPLVKHPETHAVWMPFTSTTTIHPLCLRLVYTKEDCNL
jgi:hypothetical protein